MMSKMHTMFRQNTQHSRVMNLKFKTKYIKLKNRIKNLIYENAALCDEVAQTQADLRAAKEDRRFLVKRLMRHEHTEPLEIEEVDASANPTQPTQPTQPAQPTQQTVQQEPKPNPAAVEQKPVQNINLTKSTPAPASNPRKRGPKKAANQDGPKQKTEKPRGRTRDEVKFDDKGKAIFPINLYSMMIHSIGEIITTSSNFHNAHWIFPVGYVATRMYAHPKDPTRKCVYTCKILNNAGTPHFQIIPDNDWDSVFFGKSPGACHKALLESLQNCLGNNVILPFDVQGEHFFGLSNPIVRTLIQMDPNFKLCSNFKSFLNDGFGGAGPKHNMIIAENKDPTINFDALQRLLNASSLKSIPPPRNLPPEELLNVK